MQLNLLRYVYYVCSNIFHPRFHASLSVVLGSEKIFFLMTTKMSRKGRLARKAVADDPNDTWTDGSCHQDLSTEIRILMVGIKDRSRKKREEREKKSDRALEENWLFSELDFVPS